MSWKSAPWLLDGARITSDLGRLASYAALGGAEGIISIGDCRPRALTVPGDAITIGAGGIIVRNRSTASLDEVYVADNVGLDTVDDIPATAGTARSDLVVVRIEDPQYSPWPEPPAGEEETYQYVRAFVITGVPSTTKRASDLNLGYSALEICRIDRGASTGIVEQADIIDLRKVARPRAVEEIDHMATSGVNLSLNSQTFENWPHGISMPVDIPTWATQAKISGFVEGIVQSSGAIVAEMRVTIVDVGATFMTSINEPAPGGAFDRRNYNVGGKIAIAEEYRGLTKTMRIESRNNDSAYNGRFTSDVHTSGQMRVRFEEAAD